MQPRKFRILSAITAGSLTLAAVAITASSGTNQTATHAALAARTQSFLLLNSTGTPPGQLNPGQRITSGTQIASPDGKFVLRMQSDGNLVLRAPGNIPLGDTHTAGHDGTIAVMQMDGNFVLRAPGNIPVWASGTDGHPGTVLQVQDDGGVVLYAPGHQVLRLLFPALLDPPAPGPSASAPAPSASAPVNAAPTAQVVDKAMSECGLIDIGVSGTCVITVQRWLNRLDNAALTVDGHYGPTTKAAVVAFQREHGLAPDGQVDEQTKQMLRSLYTDYLVGDLSTTAPDYEDQLMLRQMAELMCNAVGKVMAFPTIAMPAGGPLVDLFTKQYVDGCITGTYSMPSFSDVIKAVALSAIDRGLSQYFKPVFVDLFAGLQPATEDLGEIAVNLWNKAILDRIEEITDKSIACFAANAFPAAWCSWVPAVSALEDQLIR
jgi:Putative peptidoglycan binding domain